MVKPNIIKTSENPLQTIEVEVFDEYGEKLTKQIACERPLTVMLNWKEIVTLMTLGSRPESLVLGYLKNQSFLSDPEAVESIIIDWETSSAAVITKEDTSSNVYRSVYSPYAIGNYSVCRNIKPLNTL